MTDSTERTGRSSQLDAAAALHKENDYLTQAIADLERRIPSSEELEYLRKRKLEDERASWAWHWLRQNVPAIAAVATFIGTAAYWAINHLSFKPGP